MAEHEITVSAVVAEDGSLRLELSGRATLNAKGLGTIIGVLQLYRKLLDQDAAPDRAEVGAAPSGTASAHDAEDRARLDGALAGAPREQILALAKALGI